MSDLEKLFVAKDEAWQALQFLGAHNTAGKTAAERVELDLKYSRAKYVFDEANWKYHKAITAHIAPTNAEQGE